VSGEQPLDLSAKPGTAIGIGCGSVGGGGGGGSSSSSGSALLMDKNIFK